jgi:ABC-type Fe3+-hydroxamate transport system substrate-binding protein
MRCVERWSVMLRAWMRFLRWNIRLWYPVLRLLGRLTGQEKRVETWIELTEENLQNSLDKLGGDDE